MYSVLNYGEMACDGVRMDAYARAIERAVKPGSVVLDIGAGTGILSLLAAKAGARRVHAVDPNPCIYLLPELAAENGYADRIVTHPVSSFELELEEKADVIVSDLRGAFPLHGRHTEILRDARARLLRPGGVMLPARDRFFVAAVESPAMVRLLAGATQGFERRGFTARAAAASVRNSVYTDSQYRAFQASDMLTTAESWAAVEYATYGGGAFDGAVTLLARRGGTAHGLVVWFEATIDGEIGYVTAPGHATVYSRVFLPVLDAVDLEPGDEVRVTIRVDERGQRWAWDTAIDGSNRSTKGRFRQATFLGQPTSPAALLRASSSFKPMRSDRGDLHADVLAAMDGSRTVAEIAESVARGSLTADRALDEVRDVVSQFSR